MGKCVSRAQPDWAEAVPNPPSWADAAPFVPPVTSGVVIKVYDGDTITVAAHLPCPAGSGAPLCGCGAPLCAPLCSPLCTVHGSEELGALYRFSVRLRGIDSPEMHGASAAEKAAAVAARDALSALILHRRVALRDTGAEKYGRLLADVYLGPDLCVNSWMLEQKHAVPYDGGKKAEFAPSKKPPKLDFTEHKSWFEV